MARRTAILELDENGFLEREKERRAKRRQQRLESEGGYIEEDGLDELVGDRDLVGEDGDGATSSGDAAGPSADGAAAGRKLHKRARRVDGGAAAAEAAGSGSKGKEAEAVDSEGKSKRGRKTKGKKKMGGRDRE